MNKDIVIGIDPGLTGGICIIDDGVTSVVGMPVVKKVVNKKQKNVYDIDVIVKLFSKYKDDKVLYAIERQGVRPMEGSVSAMTIGENYGILKGIAYGLGFRIEVVSSVSWKNTYPDLNNFQEIIDLRNKLKDLNDKIKNEADKKVKKDLKKESEKCQRDIKKFAKEAARKLSSKMFPDIASEFEKVKDDGKAECCLLAHYAKNNL